jgi:O-methyltransferase involved in polyketide biosynthesis
MSHRHSFYNILQWKDGVDSFTNDSAMMIAYERSLESQRSNALFTDPFAAALAGSKGESLSRRAKTRNMARTAFKQL